MAVDADEVARSGARAWQYLVEAVPGGRVRRAGGAIGVVTGIPLSGFNGVWSEEPTVEPGAIAELLDEVAAAGVPYGMQLRPGSPPEVESIALERGLRRIPGEPILVLDADDGRLEAAQHVAGLSVRQVAPDEGHLPAAVAARGFEEPEEPYRRAMTPEVLTSRGMRCYVGEADGEAVATSIGVTLGECVAIFGVATLPGHRAKGYGSAVASRAVSDGLADGAKWAWLASSEAGFGVYTRLGFRVLERWDFWELTRPDGSPEG